MIIITYILSQIAKRVLSEEWKTLRIALLKQHEYILRENELCPPNVAQQLLISGEDHRFFQHCGVDFIAICRAAWKYMRFGVIEGASTLEQQIVRILTGRYERTIRRKIREILLATLVTSVMPKKDLPTLYLTIGYFGWRMNNFRQACARLNLKPKDMTPRQAAELVARLKYPEPHLASADRLMLIQRRGRHLIGLYRSHVLDSTYVGLRLQVGHEPI